mmetsp:Transcript_47966/g.80558  ORF Transcript_47966/g.80558 Transcript_47966/m.80558 type:complete len:110 (-) Transcript_47966:713-1042(-)
MHLVHMAIKLLHNLYQVRHQKPHLNNCLLFLSTFQQHNLNKQQSSRLRCKIPIRKLKVTSQDPYDKAQALFAGYVVIGVASVALRVCSVVVGYHSAGSCAGSVLQPNWV